MPFLTTAKNFEAVIRQHLAEGEELVDHFGVPRRVVGLTNQRFIVSTFPFFAAPKALIDAPLEALESFDYETKPNVVFVVVTHGGQTYREKLQAVLDDVPSLMDRVKGKLAELAPSVGGAPYFGEGEEEVGTLPVGEGMLRVSNKHVFLVNKKPRPDGSPQVDRQVPLSDVTLFDFYQSTMGSMRVVWSAGGTTTVHKVSSMQSTVKGTPGVYDGEWVPSKMANQIGAHALPKYLEDGETLALSVRAARSKAGAIKPSLWARMTDRRLVVLKKAKDDTLELDSAVPLSSISGVHVTQHEGEHGQVLNYEAEFSADEDFVLWVPSEHEAAFDRLVATIRG